MPSTGLNASNFTPLACSSVGAAATVAAGAGVGCERVTTRVVEPFPLSAKATIETAAAMIATSAVRPMPTIIHSRHSRGGSGGRGAGSD